jgi:hypothetical protein
MKTLHSKLPKNNKCIAVILTKLLFSATRLANLRTTMSSACISSQKKSDGVRKKKYVPVRWFLQQRGFLCA